MEPLERASQEVIFLLERGDTERFELPEHSLGGVDAAIARACARGRPSVELRDLVRLVIALEGTLESPTAAAWIRSRLRASEAARLILRVSLTSRGIDQLRDFRAAEGRPEPPAAPRVEAPPPAGSLRVGTVALGRLDPRAIHLAHRAQKRSSR